jgi:hypothetical protein
MTAKYTRRGLVLGAPGLLLQFSGVLVTHVQAATAAGATRVVWGPSLVTLGVVLWTAGLASYAMAKGRASWWGGLGLLGLPALTALAGLPGPYQPYLPALSLVGLVIVTLLPGRPGESSAAGGSGQPDDVW